MDNIAGSPVEGDNFFGRQAEVARQVEILANDDILLLGPRRIGKTSLARAVMAALRAEGWLTIEVNVASCIDERGFLDKLDVALRRRWPRSPPKAGMSSARLARPSASVSSRSASPFPAPDKWASICTMAQT